jgi:carbamoyl-phosphate synthase small subunit
MRGTLVVEDGTTAEGMFFGSNKRVFGELVFNTNMTGYTEALTDPSYRGQILMMTYPLIGNYGVDPASMESKEIQVTGFVVKEACPTPVHPKATMGVDRFLSEQGRPGLSGVDTRMLTIKTRTRGTMRAALVPEGGDVEGAMKEVRTMPFPDSRNLVAECSTREAVEYPGPGTRTFVVIDCGVKMNIIREAQHHGRVVQLPYDATPEDVARQKPSGVIISNGPGDPAHPDILATSVKAAKEIAAEYPTLSSSASPSAARRTS